MMRQVSELLWIGSEADVRQFAALAEAGIEAVVQLAYEEPPAPLPRDMLLWRVRPTGAVAGVVTTPSSTRRT